MSVRCRRAVPSAGRGTEPPSTGNIRTPANLVGGTPGPYVTGGPLLRLVRTAVTASSRILFVFSGDVDLRLCPGRGAASQVSPGEDCQHFEWLSLQCRETLTRVSLHRRKFIA